MSMSTAATATLNRVARTDAYAALVAVFAMLWALDAITTLVGFALGLSEMNVGWFALAGSIGVVGAWVVKFLYGFILIAFSLFAYRYLPRATCWVLALMCGGMLGVVCWNAAHLLASVIG